MSPAEQAAGAGAGTVTQEADALEAILKALPDDETYAYRKTLVEPAAIDLLPGDRSDVSWISSESPDRGKEVVIAKGMNDSQFAANPLVTLGHSYWCPPVGKSLWRKKAKDGTVAGIKAKTQYPVRPNAWTDPSWPPDAAFQLIQAGLLQGKSIGFLRLRSHAPNSHEIAAKPELAQVSRIIDEWLLLEYACTFLPTNQDALVESVSKSGVKVPPGWLPKGAHLPLAATPTIPFTTEAELAAAIKRSFAGFHPQTLITTAVNDAIHAARGGV